MNYIHRFLEKNIKGALSLGKSILLLGPRQTGKTTLINRIQHDRQFTLANPRDRLRYEKEPFMLTSEIEALSEQKKQLPLIIVDEIQKLPILMDAIQDLVDRKIAQFILTGSSARKLKRDGNINLLPGRAIPLRLDPLIFDEEKGLHYSLEEFLMDGSLPEIVLTESKHTRERLLEAYVMIYLEEEIRAEALVRDLAHFGRFLELAASESGKIVNFSKLSQEIGVSHSTIAGYYQILEDCLIVERIEPIIVSKTRKKLSKTQKYILYDLGVRRIAAREGRQPPKEHMGHLFEQFVGLELIRKLRLAGKRVFLRYWRDPSGPEVDWVLDAHDIYIPIEVKWTDHPADADIKYLKLFLKEYPQAKKGYLVCQTPHLMKLSDNIYGVPWQQMNIILDSLEPGDCYRYSGQRQPP